LLQSTHLAPVTSSVVDNDERQQHDVERQISPDLKNNEKTKQSI
jgi:hypothetical protein